MSDTPHSPNPVLTPNENQMILQSGGDPNAYGVLVAQAQVDTRQMMAMGQVQTPEGPVECIVIPLTLFIPLAQLAPRTGLLDAHGNPPNPIEGMAPILSARAVLPRARLPLRPRLFVLAANSGFDPEP
jgi:hypothetical protein